MRQISRTKAFLAANPGGIVSIEGLKLFSGNFTGGKSLLIIRQSGHPDGDQEILRTGRKYHIRNM